MPAGRQILITSDAMNPMEPAASSKRQPGGFVSATGERAAILGREAGPFEVWTWPVKVLFDLTVAVRVRGDSRRSDLLGCPGETRAISGSFSLGYAHPALTLQLRAFVARSEPLAILAFDLDCERDAELIVSFRPAFQPMWPAAFGARVLTEDGETGALFLSEEQGRCGAMVGWADAAIHGVADHGMPDHPIECRRELSAGMTHTLYFLVVGASRRALPSGAIAIEEAARGHSRLGGVLTAARALFSRAASDPAAWIAASDLPRDPDPPALLCTPDPLLQRAYDGAVSVLASSRVQVDGVGNGIVAGLAPAGAGNRPGFAWIFDGDAMCAAEALSLAGAHDQARRIFREAAARQREDGKIMHELSLSAALCDWFGEYPYAYYKAENTGAFLALLERHIARSGDRALALELADPVARALDYLVGCSEDGLFRLARGGLGCVEAGPLCGVLISEAYCQGLFVAGARGAARILDLAGRDQDRARAERIEQAAADAFHSAFFHETDKRYRFGVREGSEQVEANSAYLGLPFSFGVGDASVARSTVEGLNAPGIASDWGLRMFDRDSPHYDPAHYNTGSVFPFLNGFVVRAMYDHGLPEAGWQLLSSQCALTDFSGPGLVPEHLLGERAVEPERGVPHQAFSSAMILQGLLAGLLGLRVGDDRSLIVAPSASPALPTLELRGLMHHRQRFDLSVRSTRASARIGFQSELAIEITPSMIGASAQGEGTEASTSPTEPVAVHWQERLPALSIVHERRATPTSLHVRYSAGPHLDLRARPIQRGARSDAARLIGVETRENARHFTLSAPNPGDRWIAWSSDRTTRWEGACEIEPTRLRVAFPKSTDGEYPTAQLTAHVSEGT